MVNPQKFATGGEKDVRYVKLNRMVNGLPIELAEKRVIVLRPKDVRSREEKKITPELDSRHCTWAT